jgi:hypothetical protein
VALGIRARGRKAHSCAVPEGASPQPPIGFISIDFWFYIGVFMPAETGSDRAALPWTLRSVALRINAFGSLGVSIANESKSSDQRAFGGCLGGKRR